MILPHYSVFEHPHLWALAHFGRACAWVVFWSSLASNFLPCEEVFKRVEHRRTFLHTVAVVAFFALNWRRNQPSLGVLAVPGRKRGDECDHS